jgi:alkanesulfonate monooxygenase SsuD/methylene tetrahydromethanopterin reductase-like flavin-dependent oxidoreductase (luciferase family)
VDAPITIGVTCFLTPDTIGPAELARAAEDRFFSHLFLPEHTHIPANGRAGEHLFGGDIPVSYRRLSTLDRLSGGRFVFGAGFGWNKAEIEDHGIAFHTRRDVTRERIAALSRLWQEGDVQSFRGSHTTIDPMFAEPKPLQRPRPPVLLGGSGGPRMIKAIAEYCDGWLALTTRDLATKLSRLECALAEVNRKRDDVQVMVYLAPHQANRLDDLAELGVDGAVFLLPSGSPADVLPVMDRLAALGTTGPSLH